MTKQYPALNEVYRRIMVYTRYMARTSRTDAPSALINHGPDNSERLLFMRKPRSRRSRASARSHSRRLWLQE